MSREGHRRQLRAWRDGAPFHLALSAGYFGFAAHAGLIAAMDEIDLRPTSISGASAGALVGGLWASGLDTTEIITLLLGVKRGDFWDPGIGLGLLRGERLERLLERNLPVSRVEDTAIPLAVSAVRRRGRELTVLRNGDLARAIHASLAIPPLFMAVTIDGTAFVDGGWRDPLGTAGAPLAPSSLLVHDVSHSRRSRGTEAPEDALVLRQSDRVRFGPLSLGRMERAFEHSRDRARRWFTDLEG